MFFYCNQTSRTPTKPFMAWKVADDENLYPDNGYDEKKIFIRGRGYVRKKGKGVEIPLLPEVSLETVKNHLQKYGKYCTFHAITGYTLDSADCVISSSIDEFRVASSDVEKGSLKYVVGCVERIQATNRKIKDIMMDKYGLDVSENAYWAQYPKTNPERLVDKNKLFLLYPSYSMMGLMLTKPNLDVVHDDDKLWRHYVTLNGIENEQEFPVCMRDRLTFLFNREVSDDYEQIMKDYPLG